MERQLLPLAGGQRHKGTVWAQGTREISQVWLLWGGVHVPVGLRVGELEMGAVQRYLRIRHSGGHQENTGASSERRKRLRWTHQNSAKTDLQKTLQRYKLVCNRDGTVRRTGPVKDQSLTDLLGICPLVS